MAYADGLARGFGLSEASIARKESRERQDKLDAQREEQVEYRRGRDGVADERYQQGVERQEARDQVGDDRWNKSHELALSASKRQGSLHNQQTKINDLNISKAEEEAANRAATDVMLRWEAGQAPDESGLDVLRKAGLEPDTLFSPQLDEALQSADQIFKGQLSHNSPQSLSAMNTIFSGDLKKGVGEQGSNGGKILSKEVAAIRLGDGELVPEDHVLITLNVNTDKGSYKAPLTINRSASPDDKVKAIPIDALARHMQGLKVLKSSPQVQKIYQSLGHAPAKGQEWSKLDDGSLFNKQTGAVKVVAATDKKLSERDKEALKAYRDQYKALAQNVGPNDVEGKAKLVDIESQIDSILSSGQSPAEGNQPSSWKDSVNFSQSAPSKPNTPAPTENNRKADLQSVMDANKGWDATKAEEYLKHIGRW